jgi:hypothetical protein
MADARAATQFKGSTPKLRAAAARVTAAARTTDAERANIGVTVASTNVTNPWATSCAKSPLRAMAPPLNTGLVVPGKQTPSSASSPASAFL